MRTLTGHLGEAHNKASLDLLQEHLGQGYLPAASRIYFRHEDTLHGMETWFGIDWMEYL